MLVITVTLNPGHGGPLRPIAAASIAQTARLDGDVRRYVALLDTDGIDGDRERGAVVEHSRSAGVWALIQRVVTDADPDVPAELVPEVRRALRRRVDGGLAGHNVVDRPASTRWRDHLRRLVADAVETDPSLLDRARAVLDGPVYQSAYRDQWRELLDAGVPAVAAALRSRDDDPRKTDAPFFGLGIVDEDTCLRIITEEHRSEQT